MYFTTFDQYNNMIITKDALTDVIHATQALSDTRQVAHVQITDKNNGTELKIYIGDCDIDFSIVNSTHDIEREIREIMQVELNQYSKMIK